MSYSIKTVIISNTPGAVNSINVSNEPLIKGVKGDPGPIGPQGPTGPQGPLRTLRVETITLNATMLSNKSFSLSNAPVEPAKIELTPIGGIQQVYGVDYQYINGVVSWNGLGLDGFLELDEQIIVRY